MRVCTKLGYGKLQGEKKDADTPKKDADIPKKDASIHARTPCVCTQLGYGKRSEKDEKRRDIHARWIWEKDIWLSTDFCLLRQLRQSITPITPNQLRQLRQFLIVHIFYMVKLASTCEHSHIEIHCPEMHASTPCVISGLHIIYMVHKGVERVVRKCACIIRKFKCMRP